MENKSAMQELRWFISDGLDNFDESIKVSEIWDKVNELLEKEKQTIMNAFTDGQIDLFNIIKNSMPNAKFTKTEKEIEKVKIHGEQNESALNYYNETFKNK